MGNCFSANQTRENVTIVTVTETQTSSGQEVEKIEVIETIATTTTMAGVTSSTDQSPPIVIVVENIYNNSGASMDVYVAGSEQRHQRQPHPHHKSPYYGRRT